MPINDAEIMATPIEETTNLRHADGPRSALPAAVCSSTTITDGAFGIWWGAIPSPAAVGRWGAARSGGKGNKPEDCDLNEPFDKHSSRRCLSRRIASQCVGVILLSSPFSPTHARASADQQATS